MLYKIKSAQFKLDSSTFPPTIQTSGTITNGTSKRFPVVFFLTVYLGSGEHNFNYSKGLNLSPGDTSFSETLVLEELAFLHAIELMGNSDEIQINMTIRIGSESDRELAEKTVSGRIEKKEWILAQQEGGKPKPNGLTPSGNPDWRLERITVQTRESIEQIKTAILDDPIIKIQRNIFEKEVEAIKTHIMMEPEMKELLMFPPAIQITKIMKVNTRWAVAAAVLSSSEGYIKKWLVAHANETLQALKKVEHFGILIEKMRNQLKKDSIDIDQTIFSNMGGQRDFRNIVLHEMYEPSESELNTITRQTIDFVHYIESKKPLP